MDNKDQITYFADTDARNKRVRFGIKAVDRTKHVYVIGKTGMGKSTLLENMAVQDIRHGNGFAFIDPHGKTADLLLEYIPKERIKDVIYLAPFDIEHPIAFNVMEDVGFDKRHLVVSGLMSTFKKIWVDTWSARMEYILGNTLLALLEYPGATLIDVNRMLADKTFRNKVVANITDPSVKAFWVDEFAKYTDRFAAEATPAIQNKIGQFTSNPLIRNIIGQPKSSFDLRKIMDEKKIMIINLSKGRIGEQNANLLGSMLITKIYLSALSRADIPEREAEKLPNFYLYVDEFQSFANESFANILSEARKYKLNLTIAHQYIEQMSDEVRAAVFGNVGTLISFRVGSYDAEVLEKEFAPTFTAEDIVNLGFAQIYLRLMINGIGSQPFSATTIPPLEKPEINSVSEILDFSRKHYATPRQEVEELIRKTLASQNDSVGNGGSNGGNGGNNSGSKSKFDKRESTKLLDNSNKNFAEKNNFSKAPANNRKPLIDEKTRAELEKALNKDSESEPIEEISISDLTKKTRPIKNNVNNSVEQNANSIDSNTILKKKSENKNQNKQSLKDALLAAIGDANIKKTANASIVSKNVVEQKKGENDSVIKKEIPENELKKILGVE